MTLLEVTNLIEYIGSKQPNINTVVETENIYDLNADNYQVKYSAFCLQQQRHTSTIEGFTTFNFYAYYIDRLTLDKSNKIEVQSTGITILQNIINILKERIWITDVNASEFITFTEKFTAECAGVYCYISVTVPNTSLCAQYDINEYDFNDDFGADFWTKIANDLNFDIYEQKNT